MNEQQKYQVLAKLQNNEAPKDVAADLDVSYGAVLKLRREFDEAKLNGTIDQLLDADRLLLDEVKDKLSDVIPVEAFEEITRGLSGLEQLNDEFQQTALAINTKVRGLLVGITDVAELEAVTEIICKLQVSFLNKNMTQVNIQNNHGDSGTPKYNQFLGDKPQ